MNELSGKLVNVVLAVEDGKGMEYIKGPVIIVANFNGRVLESDPANPEECPIFNTELVWEIEKRDLRKVRSFNVPLRVECFTLDANERRVKVGFVLLSLRSAHIISKNNPNQDAPFKWLRLMGVSHDVRSHHPELYLSVSIRDCLPEDGVEKEILPAPFIAEEVYEEEVIDPEPSVPLKYLGDGFIQVGESSDDLEPYFLTIVVKVAANLDVLLPEAYVFNNTKSNYYMSFTLFGITIKSKPIRKDLHESIVLNEKIVVSLLSHFDTLQEFFSKHHKIYVSFHSDEDKLGISKINVEKLLEGTSEEQYKEEMKESISCEEICWFCLPENETAPESVCGRKPYLEVMTALEQRESEEAAPGDGEAKKVKTSSLEKVAVDATGDAKVAGLSPPAEVSPRQELARSVSYLSPRQLYGDQEKVDPQSIRYYCLHVIVESVVWKKVLKVKEYQFQFWHPRAATTISYRKVAQSDEEEVIEDVHCRIYFVCANEQIKSLLYAWRPKMTLLNNTGEMISDVAKLESDHFASKGTEEHVQVSSMKTVDSREPLAEVTVALSLEELEQLPAFEQGDLYPPVLDERVLLLQLEHLRSFKENIRSELDNDFKKQCQEKLKNLEEEWQQEKETLEGKLRKNVKKCKILTKELKAAALNLRMRTTTEKQLQEAAVQDRDFEEEVRVNYTKYSHHQYNKLIEEISSLQLENRKLRRKVGKLNEEIETNRRCALTKEQTTNLLQELRVLEEQFEDAQKQKSYFKEQWKRAVKEIHELRTEDQKQMLDELEQNKQELSQLSLDNFNSSCEGSGEASEGDQ